LGGDTLASEEEVRAFLLELKMALMRGRLQFDERLKSLETIKSLGYLVSDIPAALRGLKERDYSDGPVEDDKGRPLTWWVFGPVIQGSCIYVKIALHRTGVVCKSFHKAMWELDYPLRRE